MIGSADDTKDRFLPSVDRLEDAMRAGMRALDAGRLDEALERFNFALKLKPEYDAAWLARGSVLRRMKDDDAALQSFAQALRANGESQEGWMALAATLHGLGRLREEVEAYDALLKLHPRFVEAWVNKGAALHETKDFRAAVACYDEALALRAEHAPAWNNKGAALLRLRDEDGAARCFEEALHFDPDFFDAIVNRVLLLQRRGRHGEVVLWADRAIRLREAAFLWVAKGLAHLGLLESTLATKAFERALELAPGLEEARDGLRRANALRPKVDLYRGVYECFGMQEREDPGCKECEIADRCREVSL
ncbi:MAG: tetratricopeptide repeat protein [Methanobacteriota archaeon]